MSPLPSVPELMEKAPVKPKWIPIADDSSLGFLRKCPSRVLLKGVNDLEGPAHAVKRTPVPVPTTYLGLVRLKSGESEAAG